MRNTIWSLGLAAALAWCFGEAPGLHGQVPPAPRAGDVVPIFKFHKRKPDPQPPPETVKLQVDAFFSSLKGGAATVRPSYETLLRGSRIAERAENIDVLAAKTTTALQAFGQILAFDHYDTQTVLDRLCSVDFLTWHPAQPLQWRFVYYRPAQEWVLIDVRVSDVIEDLFE